jgi:hypothetical protein
MAYYLLFGVNSPRQLLGTIGLVQNIMSQGLEISKVGAEKLVSQHDWTFGDDLT